METVLNQNSKYCRLKNKLENSDKDYLVDGDTIYWIEPSFNLKPALIGIRFYRTKRGENTVALKYGYHIEKRWLYQHLMERYPRYAEIGAKELGIDLKKDNSGWFYF